MTHEWVNEGFCIAFPTDKGLMMDLDNMTYKRALWIAQTLMQRYKLEGYLLIKSSHHNYHVVFNRYLKWKTITKILFSQYECTQWAIRQMQEGMLALRISRKNGKDKPKIIRTIGKTDKLIKDYLKDYKIAETYERRNAS